MRLLTVLLCLLISFSTFSQCAQGDVVILSDLSGSVSGHEKEIGSAVLGFADAYRYSFNHNGIRMSVLGFNDFPLIFSELSENYIDHAAAAVSISEYDADEGTSLTSGIKYADSVLNNDRYTRKILIIITDGSPNSKVTSEEALNELQKNLSDHEVIISFIFIGSITDFKPSIIQQPTHYQLYQRGLPSVYTSNETDYNFSRRLSTPGYFYPIATYAQLAKVLAELDLCM